MRKTWMRPASLCALVLAVGLLALLLLTALSGGLPAAVEAPTLRLDDPLGAVLLDLNTPEAMSNYHVQRAGVYVLAVNEDSPAQTAGLLSGDYIAGVDGQSVQSSTELLTLLSPGCAYALSVQRGDESISMALCLPAE